MCATRTQTERKRKLRTFCTSVYIQRVGFRMLSTSPVRGFVDEFAFSSNEYANSFGLRTRSNTSSSSSRRKTGRSTTTTRFAVGGSSLDGRRPAATFPCFPRRLELFDRVESNRSTRTNSYRKSSDNRPSSTDEENLKTVADADDTPFRYPVGIERPELAIRFHV